MNLQRAFVACDLSIRAEGDGRTISGLVVPFGEPARVRDAGGPPYVEVFQRGAFTKTLAERRSPVKLLSQHDATRPIGVAALLEERDGGLFGEFRVSDTRHGNDQLALARDGALDSFSVGFAPVQHVKRDGATVRTEVKLREVSLVTFPAYESALVTGVRSLDDLTDLDGFDVEQLSSLAARLDAALTAARGSDTSTEAVAGGPLTHPGRIIAARNTLRAALIERGIK